MMDGEFPHELRGSLRRVRGAEQSLGSRRRHARRLGATRRAPSLRDADEDVKASTGCSTSARRNRSIRADRRSPAPSRASCGRPASSSRFSARPRPRPASACGAPATRCCSRRLAQQLVATLNGLGVTRIVTCDPHAFNTLRNEYPEFGGHYEVVHHTQLSQRLLAEGRIQVRPDLRASDAARSVLSRPSQRRVRGPATRHLAALPRDAPLEFELTREKAMCCGAGGGRMWMEEKIGRRINVDARASRRCRRRQDHRDCVSVLHCDDVRWHQGAREGRGDRDARHRGARRRKPSAVPRSQ